MSSLNNQGIKSIATLIAILLIATLACQTLLGNPDDEGSSGDSVEEALIEVLPDEDQSSENDSADEDAAQEEPEDNDQDGTDESAADEDTEIGDEVDGGEEADEPTEEEVDTDEEVEEAAISPPSDFEQLVLGSFGFIQEPETTEVAYAFHLTNPNSDVSIQDSEYQIAVYDENGTVIETDSGYINLVLPSESTAIGSSVWLDDGLRATEIEVQINSGETAALDDIPAMSVTTPRYYPGEYSQRATGILQSEFSEYMEDVIVTVVAYNDLDEIVGSGYSYVDWIDPGESTGVETYLTVDGDVSRIEMYPRTSYFSLEPYYGDIPEGASDFELVDTGHFQNEDGITLGLMVNNPNPNHAIEDARYSATAYADDGSVLFVDRGYFDVILPEEQMFSGSYIYLSEGEEVASIDYRLRAGEFIESDPIPQFVYENVSYLADDFSPTVTGEVTNPFNWDLEDVRVWAILYDAEGRIVGNGYDYVEFIPASGSAAAEVYVEGEANPAGIELLPAFSYYEEVLGPAEE